MKSKRMLVTGGLGFLGSALVKGLVKAGHRVRILDNLTRGTADRLDGIRKDVEIVEGDIRDAKTVNRSLKGIDSVCHLAYVNGTKFFYERPAYILDVGVKGMIHVLDGCIKNGVKELILASSSEVYQVPTKIPTDECVPLVIPNPHNPRYSYGGGKIISELMALHYGKEHFERVLIVRPHNVYGPNMGWEHVIPEFVLRMKELSSDHAQGRIPFPIQGTGDETRSFIFVDDFTNGMLSVFNRGEHLNIYNIGTDEEIPVSAVAREIGTYFDREIEIIPGKLQVGSTPRRCPDTTKLKSLGFKAEFAFRTGLSVTAEWYDTNAKKRAIVQ